jgi:serine/threonine-protein kinase
MTSVQDRVCAALTDRYHVVRELGAGGMATVYLAQDLKHDRNVALKVLKPELAAVLGADRFIAEIRTTANLQHPHILPLFDSGNADGFLYYVMPFVEGDSLRERLNREKFLGVDEAVRIAREVADALDYAHRHGVIHRDIKPENILLHDGRPMVADFGIALAVSAAGGGRMTETGISLGTPQYMSPEQATAETNITLRTDIYSLASVLYEMLAGQPPYVGQSAHQIIRKVIADPAPPLAEHRKSVPPNVAAAVAKALEKLPADRFKSAKAFADALADPAFTIGTVARATPVLGQHARADRAVLAVAAVGLLMAGAMAGVMFARRTPGAAEVVRFQLRPPQGTEFYLALRSDVTFTLSPDGSRIVFVARKPEEAVNRLYSRRRDQLDADVIAGTEGALSPFFSPDGNSIGFVSPAGAIRRVGVEGGPVQTVTLGPALTMSAPSWADDGFIVFAGADNLMHRVHSAGGQSQIVGQRQTREPSPLDTTLAYPFALPGGRLFIVSPCYAVVLRGGGVCAPAQISILDVATGRQTPIGIQAIRGWYATGHLFFMMREGALMAAAFDLRRRAVTSDPVGVVDGLSQTAAMIVAPQVALSASGSLAYLPGRAALEHVIVQVDRHGREETLIATPAAYRWPRFSPDQMRIAFGKDRQIYIHDRRSGTSSAVTFDGINQRPTWSPDGRRVAFISGRPTGSDVWVASADGAEPAKAIAPGKDVIQQSATSWTRDGAWIVIDGAADASGVNGGDDVFALPASGVGSLRTVISTPASEQTGEVSPDGRWIAYVSDDAGDFQVYVQPFLRPGGRTLISTGPAIEPAWASNNEIVYSSLASDSLVLARLEFGESIGVRRTSLIDRGRYASGAPSWREYDVSRDGQHFLFEKSLSGSHRAEPVVVLNWMAEVRRAVAKQPRR